MSNISHRVSETRLFRDKDKLGITFVYETNETAVFEKCETDEILNDYFIIEVFKTGEIIVTDENGVLLDKTDRILNLFRLNII